MSAIIVDTEGAERAACSACSVCFCDFDAETKPVQVAACGHTSCCQTCFARYVSLKLQCGDVTPWLQCPAPNCTADLSPSEILESSGCSAAEVVSLPVVWLSTQVVRNPEWSPCSNSNSNNSNPNNSDAHSSTKKCGFGFLVNQRNEGTRQQCRLCGLEQPVKRKREEPDEEMQAMMREGKLRDCPKCKMLTLKEYGICNVIHCHGCSVWWNWRTRETGRSSQELKDRARRTGSLWEAGELAFQQKLQQVPTFSHKPNVTSTSTAISISMAIS